MKIIAYVFSLPIRFYRRYISPLFPPCCRYHPTCSTYALEAVMRFGPVRGTILTLARILRCHPWARGGEDPVPETFSWKKVFSYFWQDIG